MAKVYKIHPSIGIARVGDAARGNQPDDGWFIGPETPGVPPNWDFGTKQFKKFKKGGAVSAQAARFRIWEYEEQGGKLVPLREVNLLSADVVSIEWTLKLANKKASFFAFNGQDGAQSLWQPETANHAARNANVGGQNRKSLELRPAPVSVSGKDVPRKRLTVNKPGLTLIQYLGEAGTDDAGRLLALGAEGKSQSPSDQGIGHYANNDDWFDDMADGPVEAKLVIKDAAGTQTTVEVEGAWLLVGPPDFGPSIPPFISMYDTLLDTAVRKLPLPGNWPDSYLRRIHEAWNSAGGNLGTYKPSYLSEVFPILYAAHQINWVHAEVGDSSAHAPIDPATWTNLGKATVEPPPPAPGRRRRIFRIMRKPDNASLVDDAMPRAFGDFYDIADNPGRYLSLSRLQFAILERWKDAAFLEDWPGALPPVPAQPAISPEGLDRAALENCAGAAFFPGIEAGWLLRDSRVFSAPFRIEKGKNLGKTRLGDLIVEEGFFSQQMALPWQADFLACAKEREDNGFSFAWWPTQRPDDVRRKGDDPADPMVPWARNVTGFKDMVAKWPTRGFVVAEGDRHVEVEGP
jgi:hypothetical protein